jgi:hypothetical protein
MKTSCGNSIDRCGQPIKDSGCFEVALVIRMLFRLLAPPFGLFFEIVPKFHMPNHVSIFESFSRVWQHLRIGTHSYKKFPADATWLPSR